MNQIVYVLMSGGIDSTTCALLAKSEFPEAELIGLSYLYGQRHTKEVEYAKTIADRLEFTHMLWNIQGVLPKSGVTDPNQVIPQKSYGELGEGVSPSFVAFRNGTHLSLAAAIAHQRCKEKSVTFDSENLEEPWEAIIYHGAHADDAANWAYPDCTPEFLGAMANAIYIGTYGTVRLRAPLVHLDKSQVLLAGHRWMERLRREAQIDVGFQMSDTWSCYEGGEHHCGLCPTCQSRQEAFILAGLKDNTRYVAVKHRWAELAREFGWSFQAEKEVP